MTPAWWQSSASKLELTASPLWGPSLGASIDIYDEGRPVYPLMERAAFGAMTGSIIRYATFKITGQVAQRVQAPVMSSGGIDSWEHAIEMMMYGAKAVSVCTSVMWHGWDVVKRLIDGIERFTVEQGYSSTDDFVGIALKHLTSSEDLGLKSRLCQDRSRALHRLHHLHTAGPLQCYHHG